MKKVFFFALGLLLSAEAFSCEIVITGETVGGVFIDSVNLSAVNCPYPEGPFSWQANGRGFSQSSSTTLQMGTEAAPSPTWYVIDLGYKCDATVGCVATTNLFLSSRLAPPTLAYGECSSTSTGQRTRTVTLTPGQYDYPELGVKWGVYVNDTSSVNLTLQPNGTYTGTMFLPAHTSAKIEGWGEVKLGAKPSAILKSSTIETLDACTNSPPTFELGENRIVGSESISISGDYADPDNDPLVRVTGELSKPAGSSAQLAINGRNLSFKADVPGEYIITARASDGGSNSPDDTIRIIYNRAPVIESATASKTTFPLGESISLNVEATDADNDQIEYLWSVISRPSESTADIVAANDPIAGFKPDKGGVYRIQISVSDSVNPAVTREIPITVRDYDFFLSFVEVGQSTFNPQIQNTDGFDLVKGKNTFVRVVIGREVVPDLGDRTQIGVKATLEAGGRSVDFYGSFRADELRSSFSKTLDLFHFGEFDMEGAGTISVEVNPTTAVPAIPGIYPGAQPQQESDRSDNGIENTTNLKKIYVSESSKLKVEFVEVSPPECDGVLCYNLVGEDAVEDLANESTRFMRAAFPVGKNGVEISSTSSSIDGVVKNDDRKDESFIEDIMELDSIWSLLRSVFELDYKRVVGVIPQAANGRGYFEYFGYTKSGAPVIGIRYPRAPRVVLVEEGAHLAVANMLGRSFDVPYYPSVDPVSGYWVDISLEAEPFRGERSRPSFMTSNLVRQDAENLNSRWIDENAYHILYSAFSLSSLNRNVKRARVGDGVHINGMIGHDGAISIRNAIPVLSLEAQELGDGKVEVLNPLGQKISELSFNSTTQAEVITATASENPSLVETNFSPLSLDVPFPAEAQEFRIYAKGKSTTVQPHSFVLRRAIESVRDAGLLNPPEETRQELLQIVDKIEAGFSQRNYNQAFVLLERSLRPLIEQKVIDYQQSSPLDYTRAQVLSIIDSLLPRGEALRPLVPFPQNSFVELSVDKDNYQAGEHSVATARLLTRPTNPELEFVVELELDGARQKSIRDADRGSWTAQSVRLGHGVHTWSARVFQQSKRSARAWEEAIRNYEQEKFNLELTLQDETDPEKMAEIQAEIAKVETRIIEARNQLSSIRREIGQLLEVPVWSE